MAELVGRGVKLVTDMARERPVTTLAVLAIPLTISAIIFSIFAIPLAIFAMPLVIVTLPFAICALPLLIVGARFLYMHAQEIVGQMVKEVIEKLDRKVIGADITIGRCTVSLMQGRCHLKNLKIMNPEGYKGPYMLDAKDVTIDLSLSKLLWSQGQDLEIEELHIREVDCIVEFKGLIWGESNLHALLTYLDEDVDEKEGIEGETEEPSSSILIRCIWAIINWLMDRRKLALKRVSIVDVGAKLRTKLNGPRVACADIEYDDFEKELQDGAGNTARIMVSTLIRCTLKSILAATVGKKISDWAM
eukprot:TRINITY_DN90258_c0_g1_i1.p1 TRINITY_DN90258_c0_g1~~TRINITY_DN90258_c0_g1_i1.p1  ORF type:complete len:304 (+),score=28.88 TRINITY_DN90258_c0_g1_i1:279-1190(+)